MSPNNKSAFHVALRTPGIYLTYANVIAAVILVSCTLSSAPRAKNTVKPITSLINYTFQNVTPKDWLAAAPSQGNKSLIWYPFNNWKSSNIRKYWSNPSRNPYYAFCAYDRPSRNLTVLAEPCGHIPSDGCLNSMLNVSVRRADTQHPCETLVYNPMFYNIPRWGIHIVISGTLRHLSDSQSIIYLGLSALINKLMIAEGCSNGTIFPNALEKNLFRVHVTNNATVEFFKHLKMTRDPKAKTLKRSLISSPPMTARQFSDHTVLMYYFLSFGPSCEIRFLYNEYISSRNLTVWTRYGYLNISSLYIPAPLNITDKNVTTPRTPIVGILEMLHLKKFFERESPENLTSHRRPVITSVSLGRVTSKTLVTTVL